MYVYTYTHTCIYTYTYRSATSDIDSYFDSLITSSRQVTAANRNRNADDKMAGTESSGRAAKHSKRAHARHEWHRQAMNTEDTSSSSTPLSNLQAEV
jgi:hypothetical protein